MTDELLFLIDGLDEIPEIQDRIDAARLMEEIAHQHDDCRFVVSSRLVGYPGVNLPGGREYVLEPLTREQSRALARAFYVELMGSQRLDPAVAQREGTQKGESLCEALERREALEIFARNPLLLTLAALAHVRSEGELPHHRVKLYDVAVQTLVEAWARVRRPLGPAGGIRAVDYDEEGKAVLPSLALYMHQHCPGGIIDKDDLLRQIGKRLPGSRKNSAPLARDFLKRLNDAGSLLTERGPGRWGFMHQTFQEYLAAKCLTAEDSYRRVLKGRLYHTRWQEVIRFTAGELGAGQGRAKAAAAFIRGILNDKRDWRSTEMRLNVLLAAECAADTICGDEDLEEEIVSALVDMISKERKVPWEAIKDTVGRVRGTPLGNRLGDRLEREFDSVSYDHMSVFPELLAMLGHTGVLPRVIESIKPKEPDSSDAGIPILDDKEFLRGMAYEAMGWLGNRELAPFLLDELKESNLFLISHIARALRRIGVPEAASRLMGMLGRDRSRDLRCNAVKALGEIEATEAIQAIQGFLSDADPKLRESASRALGLMGANQAIPDLMRILREDADDDCRAAAAEALGNLGSQEAIPGLIDAFRRGPSGLLRHRAALALGKLGSRDAILDFKNAIKGGRDPFMAEAAARALGMIGDRDAIPLLIDALKGNASYGLAWALGRMGVRDAIPPLLGLYRERETRRFHAVWALWRLAYDDEDPAPRRRARR